MRKPLFLYALLFVSLSVHAQKSAKSVQRNFDLKEAIAQKVISVVAEGTGGHQGECLKIVCRNLRGSSVRIRFPQGQLMEPQDSAQQTLVVAEEKWLAVTAKTPGEVLLKTFCTQAGDISPTKGSVFAVTAMAPQTLCNVLKFITEQGKTDSGAAQAAVWAVTSRSSLGSIGDPALTRFVAEQLGKATPTYTIKHKTVESVPGRTADLGKAMVVEGNFKYYLEKDEKVRMVLLDSTGKVVTNISKEERMIAGEHRSGLHLEVWNLTAGKYTVRMQTTDGRVIKDMEVEF
ncbi:MAG TPA: hypothetical protein PLO67_03935 [Saprospiraceae bacterium]|nr:hypothetical protein [Saprospiraceae bacterium]HPI05104.1 hypothetical protein [Saprospiraceae bacterium]